MEELKAMFRVCVHIKKDGTRCNSPALKGGNFCFHHIGGSLREHTRARSIYNGPKLDFLYPGTRQAIQNNLFVVAQALNDGKLELATANAYNRIFSACERNLRRFEMLCQKPDPEPELLEVPEEADDNETRNSDGGPLERGVSGEQNPSVPPVSAVVNTESSCEPDIQTLGPMPRIPDPLLPEWEANEAEKPALSPFRDNADDKQQNPSVSSASSVSSAVQTEAPWSLDPAPCALHPDR